MIAAFKQPCAVYGEYFSKGPDTPNPLPYSFRPFHWSAQKRQDEPSKMKIVAVIQNAMLFIACLFAVIIALPQALFARSPDDELSKTIVFSGTLEQASDTLKPFIEGIKNSKFESDPHYRTYVKNSFLEKCPSVKSVEFDAIMESEKKVHRSTLYFSCPPKFLNRLKEASGYSLGAKTISSDTFLNVDGIVEKAICKIYEDKIDLLVTMQRHTTAYMT